MLEKIRIGFWGGRRTGCLSMPSASSSWDLRLGKRRIGAEAEIGAAQRKRSGQPARLAHLGDLVLKRKHQMADNSRMASVASARCV